MIQRPSIFILTLLLLLLPNPLDAALTSLTFIDTSINTPFQAINSDATYSRNSLPPALSVRADITNAADTKNVQFINDITKSVIRTEGIAPYAINGDSSGVYRPWSVPVGINRLKVVQNLKNGPPQQLIITFTITAGGGSTPTPTTATPTPSTKTPTPTPAPPTPGPGSTIKFTWIDAGADKDVSEIIGGKTYSRASLPSSLSIRADIVKQGNTKNSVVFYVNGAKIRQENQEPYAIAGDSGANYFEWNGLPTGAVQLRADQLVNGAVVVTRTITFTVDGGSTPPTPTPVVTPTANVTPTPAVSMRPRWEIFSTNGSPEKRHEACFVMGDDGKAYLIGGRRMKPVDIYDPATNKWTRKKGPGIELHHMQCLAYDSKIWIGSSWTGGFPTESNVPLMYIYDTRADSWSTKPGLPSNRLRGGGAFVLHDDKMWLAMGNRGGHGGNAQTLGWLDMFDPKANNGEGAWSTEKFPNAPNPRDHTSGGIVNNKLCIGGGRDGGAEKFFQSPVAPVNCYNFANRKWEVGPDIPEPRAGASAGVNCAGHLVIAGGEGGRPEAFSSVSIWDGKKWNVGAPLERARHGSGLAVSSDCSCGKIYIASGSGARGGGPELTSTEVYLSKGDSTPTCSP